ncbi:hypothetical protein SFC65_27440 [Priestia filamentosa]|uniref:hypothetical protein n=1 Tax=Priestia filamentosa TaxID=1402861 RepID=UPI00398255D1
MKREKKGYLIAGIFLAVISLGMIGLYISDYIIDKSLNVSSVVGFILILIAWFQFTTWGSDKKVQKDEMGKKVAAISAQTSYYVLTALLFLLWIADRIVFVRKNDFGNVSLFVALCCSLVIFPIIQFFSARRYR